MCLVFSYSKREGRSNSAKMKLEKTLHLVLSLLPHPPYSPNLASSYSYHFRSLQNALNYKKKSWVDQMKTVVENYLSSKTAAFSGEESTSYVINRKRLLKITVNIQLIEINLLLNYSCINYILLKAEIIYESSQYLSVYLSISARLIIYIYVYIYMYIYIYIYMYIYIHECECVCGVCVCMCKRVCMSIFSAGSENKKVVWHLSIYLSLSLSIYLSISMYLSILKPVPCSYLYCIVSYMNS